MTVGSDIWVQISQNRYTCADIREGNFSADVGDFERSVLDFCREWLSGAGSFEFRTSGSTGSPKTIILPRHAMEESARRTQVALRLTAGFTALLCLDPRYIAGKMMMVRCFVTGMNLVAVAPAANPLAQTDGNLKIDFVALVPYQLQAILASSTTREKLNSLHAVLVGGADLDPSIRTTLETLSPAIYATYGMTETVSHIALQKLNPPDLQRCFHVLPGIRIAKDDRGCLTLSADYLGKEAIITHDLVDILGDDQFVWLGRIDSIINSGGVKVIPEKVEKAIGKVFSSMAIPNRFFVCGLPDAALGNKVVVVIEGTAPVTWADLHRQLSVGLSRFEIPKEIKSVPHFAETATQKVDRRGTMESLVAKAEG